MSSNQTVFADNVRISNRKLWNALNELHALRLQADGADFGNTFINTPENNFQNEIGPVIYATVDAILGTSLKGNIAKLL